MTFETDPMVNPGLKGLSNRASSSVFARYDIKLDHTQIPSDCADGTKLLPFGMALEVFSQQTIYGCPVKKE